MSRALRWVIIGGVLLALWLTALVRSPENGGPPQEPVLQQPATPTLLRPLPSPTASTPTPKPALTIEAFRLHPDGPLYEGDRLSFEVQVRNTTPVPIPQARVEIRRVGLGGEEILAEGLLPELPPGASHTTTWTWVWTASPSGLLSLIAVARPGGESLAPGDRVTYTVFLRPREQLPEVERQARWAQAESRCCVHHYLTGTATEAHLSQRMAWADEAEATVRARLGLPTRLPTHIVWIPRLLGHGGFAVGDSLILSDPLSERLPADVPTVLRHEFTHRMTCAWLGREDCLAHLPPFITEGLAVFVAGGHYRPEPLTQRAAALLHLGGWIPLERLVEGFYAHPHEIGYLEAGAFVEELVREGGWPRFRAFLQAMERRAGESDRQVLDRALQAVYHQDIRTLEARWQERLRSLPADPDQIDDLQFTIAFYEALRAYQRAYDPSAYFMNAWLPDWREAAREGIVADFLREPEDLEGQWFWGRLQEARRRSIEGDPDGAWKILQALCEALRCPEDALPIDTRMRGERVLPSGDEFLYGTDQLRTKETEGVTSSLPRSPSARGTPGQLSAQSLKP